MVAAYIGLGSNLDQPEQHVRTALAELSEAFPGLRHSQLYRSAPIGPAAQPDYINAVACIATSLTPQQLLALLQGIETRHGRVRAERWGARTLDLDLLLYDDCQLHTPSLIIPHPEMHRRGFVLMPLCELDDQVAIPGLGLARELMTQLDCSDLHPL